MNAINGALEGQRVLWAVAHPDDLLIAGQVLGGEFDTLVASRGEKTSVNHYAASDKNFTAAGGRTAEALAIANRLGSRTIKQEELPDGDLTANVGKLAEAIYQRFVQVGATALGSTLGHYDHPDHRAVGAATNLAAMWLARDHNVSVPVVQLYNVDATVPAAFAAHQVTLPPRPEATRRILDAATLNGSQQQIKRADSVSRRPLGWRRLNADPAFIATPDTIKDLVRYSIWRPVIATVIAYQP